MQDASALLALQDADLEIMRMNKRLDELPEKRAILEVRAKQREVAQMRDKAALLVRKLEAEVKARQDEIATLTEKIDAEQKKVMETSDHRAVQSITREMDGLRRRVDKLEMESMQYMERIEKASAQVSKIEEALATLGETEKSYIERFRKVGGELQDEISSAEKKRKKLAKGLDPELLKQYESIRAAKGGIGAGKLDGDSCSACRMSLPAERLRDLKGGPPISTCPQCRRLIVVSVGEDE